jgi:hypothetical protein
MVSGLTPPNISATKVGSVSMEGTNLIGPWVCDGANGTINVIRIGDKSTASVVSSFKASLLNPTVQDTAGTAASGATCELGTIAAPGEFVIRSADLKVSLVTLRAPTCV